MSKAFKCINNELVNKALDEHKLLMQNFDTEGSAITEPFGGEVFGNYWRNGRRAMVGMRLPKGSDHPGKMWRLDEGYQYRNNEDIYVPNARTNAGKELRARIARLAVGEFDIPGLPMSVFLPERSLMLYPGSYQIEDCWYADYSFDLPEDDAQEVDRTIWEDMRASELMRLREDEEARAKQDALDSEVRDAQGNVARIEG